VSFQHTPAIDSDRSQLDPIPSHLPWDYTPVLSNHHSVLSDCTLIFTRGRGGGSPRGSQPLSSGRLFLHPLLLHGTHVVSIAVHSAVHHSGHRPVGTTHYVLLLAGTPPGTCRYVVFQFFFTDLTTFPHMQVQLKAISGVSELWRERKLLGKCP